MAQSLEMLIPIVLGTSMFALVGWIVFVIVDGGRQKAQQKILAEFHAKFLEKMGSSTEFGAFLESEGGARFFKTLSVEGPSAKTRIVRSTERGILCLFIGIVLLMLGRTFAELHDGLIIIGAIVTACGVGNLFACGASYALSKNLGLIENDEPKARQ